MISETVKEAIMRSAQPQKEDLDKVMKVMEEVMTAKAKSHEDFWKHIFEFAEQEGLDDTEMLIAWIAAMTVIEDKEGNKIFVRI